MFNPYPFERLSKLLENCTTEVSGLNLSIGEPAFHSPKNVVKEIQDNAELIRYYPKLDPMLAKAQIEFVMRRFNVKLHEEELVPTFGSREVLFNFVHFIFTNNICKKNKSIPTIAFPNPFYQIYEGAQIANHANAIYMPLIAENDFKPKLCEPDLQKVSMVILNSPNNPTGQILTKEELIEWVKLALEYDFILVNDECYSEIYMKNAPPSILEASFAVGNTAFKNVFAINSISKRLASPGLRSGFIAGDSKILQDYRIFRTYVGISMPLTLQKASITAWLENDYAEVVRVKFAKNLTLAKEIFCDINILPYTFYMWLCVAGNKTSKELSSDMLFTQQLYKQTGHKVLPGSYLGRDGGGIGYVRIALTHEAKIMQKTLQEIKTFYDSFIAP